MIGGSTTFGHNVPLDDSYPAVAAARLRHSVPERCFDVINGGVSGAHSYHHLLRTRHLYRSLDIDIVTIYTGWN
ncbi:MAG: hypothetical protein GY720_07605, partial [bacterium]|nr:hypothetical protein [bacterium]